MLPMPKRTHREIDGPCNHAINIRDRANNCIATSSRTVVGVKTNQTSDANNEYHCLTPNRLRRRKRNKIAIPSTFQNPANIFAPLYSIRLQNNAISAIDNTQDRRKNPNIELFDRLRSTKKQKMADTRGTIDFRIIICIGR